MSVSFRRWSTIGATLVVCSVLTLLVVGREIRLRLDSAYKGYPGSYTKLLLRPGTSARAAAQQLQEAGVVESATTLVLWLRWKDWADRIHSGEYRFEGSISVVEVADMITRGRVLMYPVTIPEGSDRWQVAAALERAGFGSREAALRAMLRTELIADLDTDAETLEGYVFPDTYMAPRTATTEGLIELMVTHFRSIWTAARQARAQELGMTVREVVTLASMVEAEVTQADERSLVSGVFHNRLERRMLLQCDPTLLYALRLSGRSDRNIRRRDFELKSPYNTYRVGGLPTGPIGNPGEGSLDAALWPADVAFLYFVSRNDGSHVFSRTLQEHNRMVNRYQR